MARTRTSLSRISALAIVTISSITFVTGCSNFKEPNEKNFKSALNEYYSAHDDCLFTNTLRFPYETSRSDESGAGSKGHGRADRLRPDEAAGG